MIPAKHHKPLEFEIQWSNRERFDVIEEALVFLELSERRGTSPKGYSRVPLAHFNNTQLLADVVHNDDWGAFFDVTPNDVSGVDVRTMTITEDKGPAYAKYVCHRLRRVPVTELRGRIGRPFPHYFEYSCAMIERDGTYVTFRIPYGWNNGWYQTDRHNWHRISKANDELIFNTGIKKAEPQESDLLQTMLGTAFSQRYFWHIYVGFGQGLRIGFPTDPVGAREMFKLRDIPPGKKRRQALKHWVTDHFRKNRKDAADESYVREHLRGATQFTWNGLDVLFNPSEFDLEKNAKLEDLRRLRLA